MFIIEMNYSNSSRLSRIAFYPTQSGFGEVLLVLQRLYVACNGLVTPQQRCVYLWWESLEIIRKIQAASYYQTKQVACTILIYRKMCTLVRINSTITQGISTKG